MTAGESAKAEPTRELLRRKWQAYRLLNTQKQFGDAFTLVGIFNVAYEICPEMDAPTMVERDAKFEQARQELATLSTEAREALKQPIEAAPPAAERTALKERILALPIEWDEKRGYHLDEKDVAKAIDAQGVER